MKGAKLYGMVAEWSAPEPLLRAVRQARIAGYKHMDAYTPFPVDELAEALGMRWTFVPIVTLVCGVGGGVLGYGMQWFSAVVHYPLLVAGKPLHSWPAFVPVTFELTILGAALGAAVGMLLLNGLPRPHHPIFNTPHFAERNASRFYLCLEARGRGFKPDLAREFLRGQEPDYVWEVEA